MNHPISDKQTYPKSALKQQIRSEVELGIALSANPVNAHLPDLAVRTTTLEKAPPHSSPAVRLVKQFVSGIETTWRPFGERINPCPLNSET